MGEGSNQPGACMKFIACPAKIQLMKKVIVRMQNNQLQLNFHPKLSALAKSRPLNVHVTLSVKKNNQARQNQKFTINYSKIAQEGENKQVNLIDTHLRYLMLYHAFEKICSEVAENENRTMSVERGDYTARTRVILGSILDIELELRFFAKEVED